MKTLLAAVPSSLLRGSTNYTPTQLRESSKLLASYAMPVHTSLRLLLLLASLGCPPGVLDNVVMEISYPGAEVFNCLCRKPGDSMGCVPFNIVTTPSQHR